MTEIILYNQSEVAKQLKISPKTLEAMRQTGNGPKYCKIGRRVLYRYADIMEFIGKNLFNSTSEYKSY
jgi:hypothetical protein